jgi:hypothetical protein
MLGTKEPTIHQREPQVLRAGLASQGAPDARDEPSVLRARVLPV